MNKSEDNLRRAARVVGMDRHLTGHPREFVLLPISDRVYGAMLRGKMDADLIGAAKAFNNRTGQDMTQLF